MTTRRLQRIISQTSIIGNTVLDTIPIDECHEPLINIFVVVPNAIAKLSQKRREFAGSDVLAARETVCMMLAQAAKTLSPCWRLVVFDAYRPIEYQQLRYQQVYHAIARENPNASKDTVEQLTFQVVFPPNDDPMRPPPHATGGAVDVAIATTNGVLVDFGSTYGLYNETENPKHFTNSTHICQAHWENRLILLEAMAMAGFCNYPGEWWHFMYGDREYAAYEGLPCAIYGRADLIC